MGNISSEIIFVIIMPRAATKKQSEKFNPFDPKVSPVQLLEFLRFRAAPIELVDTNVDTPVAVLQALAAKFSDPILASHATSAAGRKESAQGPRNRPTGGPAAAGQKETSQRPYPSRNRNAAGRKESSQGPWDGPSGSGSTQAKLDHPSSGQSKPVGEGSKPETIEKTDEEPCLSSELSAIASDDDVSESASSTDVGLVAKAGVHPCDGSRKPKKAKNVQPAHQPLRTTRKADAVLDQHGAHGDAVASAVINHSDSETSSRKHRHSQSASVQPRDGPGPRKPKKTKKLQIPRTLRTKHSASAAVIQKSAEGPVNKKVRLVSPIGVDFLSETESSALITFEPDDLMMKTFAEKKMSEWPPLLPFVEKTSSDYKNNNPAQGAVPDTSKNNALDSFLRCEIKEQEELFSRLVVQSEETVNMTVMEVMDTLNQNILNSPKSPKKDPAQCAPLEDLDEDAWLEKLFIAGLLTPPSPQPRSPIQMPTASSSDPDEEDELADTPSPPKVDDRKNEFKVQALPLEDQVPNKNGEIGSVRNLPWLFQSPEPEYQCCFKSDPFEEIYQQYRGQNCPTPMLEIKPSVTLSASNSETENIVPGPSGRNRELFGTVSISSNSRQSMSPHYRPNREWHQPYNTRARSVPSGL
ncbi:hypothetical protein PtA15_4A741 [Puccinia triticina]|uniref:Uncharacterized protein n=1 Tax=Puccinia triticina TaxID=208348 RepID=A0ABY7CHA1_9BASI|nr:uncharacterized protein PtA15_4A741 [Puccinia triticina]WAQ84288.1 hypothetical protein PtA15_4A741 [Puccinia triticina]